MRYLIVSKRNFLTSASSQITLNFCQLCNIGIARGCCSTICCDISVCFVIQSLSSHYDLTSLSNNGLLLSTVNITSQRRNQQRCQNRQNNQNHDQLYQRKAALLAAALLLQRDHFFHHDLIPPILFLFFYLCKLRRCSAELHILHCRYAGFFVAVTSVFTGISYRRSIMSESE